MYATLTESVVRMVSEENPLVSSKIQGVCKGSRETLILPTGRYFEGDWSRILPLLKNLTVPYEELRRVPPSDTLRSLTVEFGDWRDPVLYRAARREHQIFLDEFQAKFPSLEYLRIDAPAVEWRDNGKLLFDHLTELHLVGAVFSDGELHLHTLAPNVTVFTLAKDHMDIEGYLTVFFDHDMEQVNIDWCGEIAIRAKQIEKASIRAQVLDLKVLCVHSLEIS